MISFFQILLILHVVFGLAAISFFMAALVGFLKTNPKIRFLKLFSFSGLVFILLAWLTGGYYYVFHYGSAVKPLIKAGVYPWVHSVVMESKEHIFLFLPFLAAVFALLVWLSGDEVASDRGLKKSAILIILAAAILGIAITLGGLLISGAVT